MIANRTEVLSDRSGRRSYGVDLGLVALTAAAAAGGAALAGCHPTGTVVLDPLYCALLGAMVVAAAAVAPRGAILWLGVVGLAMSRGWIAVVAAAGLALAFAGAVRRQPSRLLGSLAAAVSIQAILRWTHVGFHGATAAAAAAAVLPLLLVAFLSLPRQGRKLVLLSGAGLVALAALSTVPVLVEVLLSRNAVQQGTSAAQSALDLVKSGEAQAGRAQLDRAVADFRSASGHLGSAWTGAARAVPFVAEQRQALAVAADVAEQVSQVARNQAAGIDFGQLRYQNGGLDLARIASLRGPLDTVHSRLLWADRRLATIRSPWLVGPIASRIAGLSEQLSKAESSTQLAETATTDAPSLLGAEGTRHYFVAFTEPAESRGLGGLLLWYADVSVTNGRIKVESYGDAHNLATALAARGGGHLTGPASYLTRYGGFGPQNTFIDLTYSPDLPTVTAVVSQLYSQLGHPPIDGMFVLDPKSLASLVRATGPLTVPGLGTLTGENTAELLDRGQYDIYPSLSQDDERKAALDDALGLASQRLAAGSLPGVHDLTSDLGPDVRTGDLLFWSVHPGDQPLLLQAGLAGSFPAPDGHDLLSVITQNAANNKLDAYLQRDIRDQVTYNPSTGAVSARVTVTLRNTATASGLSQEVIGSYPGSGLPPATNLAWITLYSPLHLVRAEVGSSPVEVNGVPELGSTAYSTYVRVGPRSSQTVTYSLSGVLPRGGRYGLVLHQQPMVLPDHVVVDVAAAKGWAVEGRDHWEAPPGLNPYASFGFRRAGS